MKLMTTSISIFVFVAIWSMSAQAQVMDPSTLGWISGSSDQGQDTEPGRYVIKKTKAKRIPAQVDDKDSSDTSHGSNGPAEKTLPPKNEPAAKPESTTPPMTWSQQIHQYRQGLGNDDTRRNYFDLNVAASYIYDGSNSQYFYRNYNSQSPGIDLGLNVWFAPFVGLDIDYRTSLLAQTKDGSANASATDVSHRWFNIGMAYRKFFSDSDHAPSFDLGLAFTEYTMVVGSSAQTRYGISDQGLDIKMSVHLPGCNAHSNSRSVWSLGFDLEPWLSHGEDANNSNISSGSSNDTLGLGAFVRYENNLSRKLGFFMRGTVMDYRSLFSGQASVADPTNGQTPSNVAIDNTFLFFDMGIRFSD